ncbi:S-adenosyl-L-methionine-dependent methyltransferase [Cyathus striatus]|nr:S-adenosyl-L-methionine-dependent methyltransferase [Cyathus striatus]
MENSEQYKLPTDELEMDRLTLQHRMWKLLIGGLYPPSLDAIIRENILPTDADCFILDVGCGSAIWAIEMAKEFPRVHVVGFDLNQQSYRDAPDNFSFIQGDLSRQLPSNFLNKFSLVHCRCVAQHVSDPHALVITLASCLKPGGLLLLADGDWVAFDEQRRLLTPFKWNPAADLHIQLERKDDISWYAGWVHAFGTITRSVKYENIDILLQKSAAYQDIRYCKYFSPINWCGDEIMNGEEIGKLMSKNMRDFFDGGVSVMVNLGVPSELLQFWRKRFMAELDEHRYNVWHFASAVKT